MCRLLLLLSVLLLNLIVSSSTQKKRKRLVEEFSTDKIVDKTKKNLKKKCEICYSNKARKKVYSASKEEKMYFCDTCFTKAIKPQKEEQIFIHNKPKKKLILGKFIKERLGGRYEVEILEGKKKGQHKIIRPEDLTKLFYDMIPSKKLCPICGFLKFKKHKCERENCHEKICAACFDKIDQCAFCRLLHVGTMVKIKQNNLRKTKSKILTKVCGKHFVEVYGYIVDYKHLKKKQHNAIAYRVSLYGDYFWIRDESGEIVSADLEQEIDYDTTLRENEVEVLKPQDDMIVIDLGPSPWPESDAILNFSDSLY